MASLKKKVSTLFRQLSFHHDESVGGNFYENFIIQKYLNGSLKLPDFPVFSGRNPKDLPIIQIDKFQTGTESIVTAISGPDGGIKKLKKLEKKSLEISENLDFIDGVEETENSEKKVKTKIEKWDKISDCVYGISESLYDFDRVMNLRYGTPIADCFGVIARKDSCLLAVADGVNWGEKSAIAARSAVYGALSYLEKTIFRSSLFDEEENEINEEKSQDLNIYNNTTEIFIALLRSFSVAHDLILENEGNLTTLTVVLVLPHKKDEESQTKEEEFVVCACNVGDTLAYVYSNRHGLRELTKASHDILENRDYRDALGALGPYNGKMPELANLTLSLSKIDKDDFILVATDGLYDNFDPEILKMTDRIVEKNDGKRISRSKTSLELRKKRIMMNEQGQFLITPIQRYELQLLALDHAVRGVATPKILCEKLTRRVFDATAPRRRVLERRDVEVTTATSTSAERRRRRRKLLEAASKTTPGKLDHATIVAYKVGSS